MPSHKERTAEGLSLRIAVLYAVLGGVWIFFSDRLAALLFPSPEAFTLAATVKGWVYVLVTALLLYALIERGVKELTASREALRVSEANFRALVQRAGSIIFRMDRQGRITFVNDYALKLFGCTLDEVLGKPATGIVVSGKDSGSGVESSFVLEILEHPEHHPTQLQECVRSDGERLWVAWTTTLVPGPSGGEPEILCIGNDVTEQKATADALLDGERRLNQVLENANDGYFDWDLVRDQAYFSPRYYRMLDYEPGEFPAGYRVFLRLAHPEDHERVRSFLSRMRRCAEDSHSVEFRMRCKDGRWKWILGRCHVAERDSDGNTTRLVGIHLDITDHKQAEETIQRYGLLAAQSRDIFFMVRREDGRILEANAAATETYGFSREELLGMTVHDLRWEDPPSLTAEQMAEADTRGILFEAWHKRKDGTAFPVEVSSRGATIGDTRLLVSVVRDITERTRAEKSLRESQERLRLALDAARAGTWEWDLVSGDKLWSEELWGLIGADPRCWESTDDAWRATVHPDDLEKTERAVAWASLEGERINAEWRVRRADGTERWLLSQGQPVPDPEGRIRRYIGIVLDVTERKRIETALRQWADAFEFCAHGIAIGVPATGRILVCNPAFARMQRRSVSEVAGMLVLDVYDPVFHDTIRLRIAEADRTGQVRYETFMKRGDGSSFPVQVDLVSVRGEAGEILYRVATVQDISERRRAEEDLHQSLEEKTALLREVHHRVKNNLQIVASLLNLQANRSGDPRVLEMLTETRNRVHSMALLHEVLYRSGNLARINFNAYVEELCRHLLRVYGNVAASVRIENRVARIGLPLEQSVPCGLIISELVSNALKHAFPEGREGKIVVCLPDPEENELVLSVTDDGVGFPPGWSAGSASTLGLRLVCNLAAQLGGRLDTLVPEEGSGTSFRLVMPFNEVVHSRSDS